ncbi:hypothetical protein FBFR_02725 [Flavobacterium fryxellicola]|uniref:Uncharacterized protein n=1 Tax=Flavobacterium fryxellicola TaxID=249352 RepID=A0A167ZHA2_9FLAO|nr:hypothetical protein FBFR_02725 [Flavobacterium fryxellicola]
MNTFLFSKIFFRKSTVHASFPMQLSLERSIEFIKKGLKAFIFPVVPSTNKIPSFTKSKRCL